ncbi:MAG: hypothetical protein RIB55_17910 [Nitratireductor sp.]|jgi:hypothetical protein
MKAASSILQVLALSACFAANMQIGTEFKMAGVRRAIQTIAASVEMPAGAQADILTDADQG